MLCIIVCAVDVFVRTVNFKHLMNFLSKTVHVEALLLLLLLHASIAQLMQQHYYDA